MKKRLALGSLAVTAAVAVSTFAFASPAAADPAPCSYNAEATCAFVLADVLNVRTGPGTNYSVADTVHYGQEIEIFCWTEGTYVNGYNIWTRLDNPLNLPRYVSDYYLSTGNVQSFLPHC